MQEEMSLRIDKPRWNFFHFSESCKEEFLKQFTTKNRKTKDENGYSKLRWVKICDQNEAFGIILLAYSGVKMTKW